MQHGRGHNEGHRSPKRLTSSSAVNRVLTLFCLSLLLLSTYVSVLSIPQEVDEGPAQEDPVEQPFNARSQAIEAANVTLSASPNRVYVGEEVTFFANASSDVGTTLTFVMYYDILLADYSNNTHSPYSVNSTGNPGSIVTRFTYDRLGNLTASGVSYFRVRLYVSDGVQTVSKGVNVYVVENSPPVFVSRLASSRDVDPGVVVNFSTTVSDIDDDSLAVTWDFGDGSAPAINETGPAALGVVCRQSHAWNPYIEPGTGDYTITYWLNVTVDDGQGHTIRSTTAIRIYIPWNLSPDCAFFASVSSADPYDVVAFYASANDYEGDPLTWTFVFNNSFEDFYLEVYHTDPTPSETTVWVNTTYVFGAAGNYTVTLYVADTLLEEQQVFPHNLSQSVSIVVSVNHLPFALNVTNYPQDAYLNDTTGICVVQLVTEARDPDGDVITLTWDFGDGSEPGVNVSGGGMQVYKFVQVHEYTVAGYHDVTLNVTDGRLVITTTTTITIRSNNTAPKIKEFKLSTSSGSYALPNSTVIFDLVLNDAERDPIEVTWDFGDGSPLERYNLSDFDETGNVSIRATHVYLAKGYYNVTISFTDHMFDTAYHNSSRMVYVTVALPRVVVLGDWSWWDFTSLGLFLSILPLLALRVVLNRRLVRKIDQLGMTLDEYRLHKKMEAAKKSAEKKESRADSKGGA
jgi:hypothetical protein